MKSIKDFINEASDDICIDLNKPKDRQRVFISTSKDGKTWTKPANAHISSINDNEHSTIVTVFKDGSYKNYYEYSIDKKDTSERKIVISDPRSEYGLGKFKEYPGFIITIDKSLIDNVAEQKELQKIIEDMQKLRDQLDQLEKRRIELEKKLSK